MSLLPLYHQINYTQLVCLREFQTLHATLTQQRAPRNSNFSCEHEPSRLLSPAPGSPPACDFLHELNSPATAGHDFLHELNSPATAGHPPSLDLFRKQRSPSLINRCPKRGSQPGEHPSLHAHVWPASCPPPSSFLHEANSLDAHLHKHV